MKRSNERTRWAGMLVGGAWYGAALAAAVITLLAVPARAATTMYKWTDEKGVVHYTDKMPAESVNRGNVQLNKEGLQVRKVDPAVTQEQRDARANEEQQKKIQAREKEELARHDRAVLDSYTTEGDIELARNRALKTIDSALQSAQSYTEQLTKRKSAMQAKKVDPSDKNGQAALDRDLARIDADLARQSAFVAQKQKEVQATNTKYDEDRDRFRAAMARKQASDSTAAVSGSATAPTQTGKKP